MTEVNPYAAPQADPGKIETNAPFQGAPSPYGPWRKTKWLSNLVTGLFLILILCYVAKLVLFSTYISRIGNVGFDWFASEEGERIVANEEILVPVSQALTVLIIIFWLIWTNKSCKNAWLIAGRRGYFHPKSTFTPGWAAGWYFVPVALLWKPFQAIAFMRDASQKSQPSENSTQMGNLLGFWWTFWITNNILSKLAQRSIDNVETPDSFVSALYFNSIVTGISIIAAIAAILVARRLTKIQYERAHEFKLPETNLH